MKIKEVIARTGLTDRAIRLYIENGLIMPENQKSYTGRNSFDFTEADVRQLEQIALLRKADFSIEQIKVLQAGGVFARDVLRGYLNNKQNAVADGQQIVEALKDFPADTPVTVESVCRKLWESIESKIAPEAERIPSKGEQWEKWFMRIISGSILFFWGLFGIGALLTYQEDFLFPQFYKHPVNYIGVAYVLLPIIVAIVVFFLYRKPLCGPNQRKKRGWTAGIALGVAIFVAIQPIGIASLVLMPPVYSQTANPGNYLALDTYVQMYGDGIYKLFPANIPRSAVAENSKWYPPDKFPETTKYYYYFQNVIDPSFQIYAEWILTENELAEELVRFQNYYPDGPKQQVQWGDWVCMSFEEDPLANAAEISHYYYLMFAYNPETCTVRYIATYGMDATEEDRPYFLSLSW